MRITKFYKKWQFSPSQSTAKQATTKQHGLVPRDNTVIYACGTQSGAVAATLVGSLQLKALRNLQEGDGDVARDLRSGRDGNITGGTFRRVFRLFIFLSSISGGNLTIPNMITYHLGLTLFPLPDNTVSVLALPFVKETFSGGGSAVVKRRVSLRSSKERLVLIGPTLSRARGGFSLLPCIADKDSDLVRTRGLMCSGGEKRAFL